MQDVISRFLDMPGVRRIIGAIMAGGGALVAAAVWPLDVVQWVGVGVATLGGLYMGRQTQQRGRLP